MLSSATIIGRTHRLMHQNAQDYACTGTPAPGYAFGLVLDGCGSKFRAEGRTVASHNEVGAKLLGQFAAGFLMQRLKAASDGGVEALIDATVLVDELYSGCLDFLKRLLEGLSFADEGEQIGFMASRLLCTLVGFFMTPGAAAFFWSGDGYLCRGTQIQRLESNNHPDYMAYRLLPGNAGALDAPGGFQMKPIDDIDETDWLAVATDGWSADLLRELALPRSSLALQRWVNQMAQMRERFEDDGAVSVWWRSAPLREEKP